jgi:hypothetical protein
MLKEELLPAPLKKQLTLSLQSGFVLKRSVSALFGIIYGRMECDDGKINT